MTKLCSDEWKRSRFCRTDPPAKVKIYRIPVKSYGLALSLKDFKQIFNFTTVKPISCRSPISDFGGEEKEKQSYSVLCCWWTERVVSCVMTYTQDIIRVEYNIQALLAGRVLNVLFQTGLSIPRMRHNNADQTYGLCGSYCTQHTAQASPIAGRSKINRLSLGSGAAVSQYSSPYHTIKR